MNTVITSSLTLLSLLLSYSVAAEPLYFKATKGDTEMMILGSIHMGNEQMYPLPDAVMTFLQDSDAVITEIKLSDARPSLNFNTALTTDVLNNQQKQQLEAINIELGFASNTFLTSPAWQTALTLQMSQFSKMGLSQELGIDSYITQQATALDKTILGLETIEYQLKLFTQDPKVNALLLTDTIDNWQENVKNSECLIQSWQAGNKQQLANLALQSAIGDELGDQFIFQRNHNWAEKLNNTSFINNGRYLVVVGALHLVGNDNLIDLLAKKGFTVTQISNESVVDCL